MRILVVDDEPDLCSLLEQALVEHGHETRSAGAGRQAIAIGARFHPQVLVSDWMLGDGLHGLQVAAALRAVEPTLQTILVSGFGSEDLLLDAEEAQVFRLLDKPVPMPTILEVVAQAGQAPPPASQPPSFGLVEVEQGGHLAWFNDPARALFATSAGGATPSHLDEVLDPGELDKVADDAGRWFEVAGRPLPGDLPPRWWAACRPLDGNRLLLALLHPDMEHERRNSLLRILLGHPAPTNGWPFPGTDVLVLDDERFLRNFYVSLLEQVGCVCYRTDEPELALRLFAGSPRLKVVLMDHDMPGIGPADRARLVRRLREIRPGVRIVGNSGQDRGLEFADLGVPLFLSKPWPLNKLIDLLRRDGLV
jgi:CheY-like chemotaxis protein